MEHEPDRQEHGALTIIAGTQHEPRGAGAKRHQRGLGLAHALRKDQECVSLAERLPGGAEHRLVVDGAHAFVLASVHRDGAGEADELADDRIAEERSLGDGTEAPWQRGGEQDSVHEPLLVSRGDDERPRRRHALEPDHLDTTIEEAGDKARESPEEAIGGGLSQGRGR